MSNKKDENGMTFHKTAKLLFNFSILAVVCCVVVTLMSKTLLMLVLMLFITAWTALNTVALKYVVDASEFDDV